MLEGVIPVNKPAGWTSHDVVAKVRRLSKIRRIGHTGTLDPEATGVLPLCIGRATRLVEYLQETPKEYVAVVRFGIATDTQDWTGKVVEEMEQVLLDPHAVERAALSFVGSIMQVPPMYSAVKHNGKKLYELARQGIEVERKARRITIYKLEVLDVNMEFPHPSARIRVLCSKGTYIRTLCYDIGRKLGVPATMESLERTCSGDVTLDMCHSMEHIEQAERSGRLHDLIVPADQLLSHMPAITIDEAAERHVLNGRALEMDLSQLESARNNTNAKTEAAAIAYAENTEQIRLYSRENQFLGIFEVTAGKDKLRPVKVFLPHRSSERQTEDRMK